MPKVDIESFWDRLGVELWPNYCFEPQYSDLLGMPPISVPLAYQPQKYKINPFERFEHCDASHKKERAKVCRKLKSRASETVWASSYGQTTVLKPRNWVFARGGGFVHLYQRPTLRLQWGVSRGSRLRLQWGVSRGSCLRLREMGCQIAAPTGGVHPP